MPKPPKKKAKTATPAKKRKVATKHALPIAKKPEVEPVIVKPAVPQGPAREKDYIFSVGRRKSAVARVRYFQNGKGEITVNNLNYKAYFPYFEWWSLLEEPLTSTNLKGQGSFSVRVTGGGKHGQAESVRLGISRALVKSDEHFRAVLRSNGLLTRDSREVERKKYGLRKARRAPQWQKR